MHTTCFIIDAELDEILQLVACLRQQSLRLEHAGSRGDMISEMRSLSARERYMCGSSSATRPYRQGQLCHEHLRLRADAPTLRLQAGILPFDGRVPLELLATKNFSPLLAAVRLRVGWLFGFG